MASTFKRNVGKADPVIQLPGTKPWTGGIRLTSTGLRELDALLGAGQPLGTCIYMEEDAANLATTLAKYWCAEVSTRNESLVNVYHPSLLVLFSDMPVHCAFVECLTHLFVYCRACQALTHQQCLLVPVESDNDALSDSQPEDSWSEDASKSLSSAPTKAVVMDFINSLPRDLSLDRQSNKTDTQQVLPAFDEQEEEEEDGLQIAWQYKKSVQKDRLGGIAPSSQRSTLPHDLCHSYDLNGRLKDQINVETSVLIESVDCCEASRNCSSVMCGIHYYKALLTRLQTALSSNPNKVVRLLLLRPNLSTLQLALPLLLSYIREHLLPVVVLIVAGPCTSRPASLLRLSCDVVLSIESFVSRATCPPEFNHLHGLLHVQKTNAAVGTTAHGGGHFGESTLSKRPAAHVYGIKRDRRKLHLSLLHIPPEEFGKASGGLRTSMREVRGGCSSGGAMDF
jgi:PAXNEB protein